MNHISENPSNNEEIINLGAYLNIIKRAKWRILGFSIVVTLLTIMVTLTLIPKYSATATLLIEAEQTKAVSFEEIYGSDSTKKEYYLTQFEVIKSDSIAREVITKLDLKSHKDFIAKPSALGEMKTSIKELLPFLNKKDFTVLSLEEQTQRDMIDLLAAFKSRLSVEPIRNTQLVRVSFESSDPKLAALVANTVGEVYIETKCVQKWGLLNKHLLG